VPRVLAAKCLGGRAWHFFVGFANPGAWREFNRGLCL